MRIAIINGPNLNLVGTREPAIYGTQALADFLSQLAERYPQVQFTTFQSNHEGALIDEVQRAGAEMDAIVINGGAYSHTSLALADALRAVSIPAIEVHISNIFAREPIRQHSLLAPACLGIIAGMGLDGYRLAIEALLGHD